MRLLATISTFLTLLAAGCSARALQWPSCHIDASVALLSTAKLTPELILNGDALPRTCLADYGASTRPHRPATGGRVGAERPTLVYVTPWNSAGYNYTLHHARRIHMVSPVWYQLRVGKGGSVVLEGAHEAESEANAAWLAGFESADTAEVLPRFEVQFASPEEAEAMLFFPRGEAEKLAELIAREVALRRYAGAVLEMPGLERAVPVVKKIGAALHDKGKKLVVVGAPPHDLKQEAGITRQAIRDMGDAVDFVSLMTYDHSQSVGREVGNAPYGWMREVLEALTLPGDDDADDDDDIFGDDDDDISGSQKTSKTTDAVASKLLLGLNFYGFTLTKDGVINTITSQEYGSLVEFGTVSMPHEVQWTERLGVKEHRLVSQLWSIWYPTCLSLLWRKSLADEFGVGLAVWEGGQGLDYFWDVLLDGPVR